MKSRSLKLRPAMPGETPHSKIIARILEETGQPDLLRTLVESLSPTDLQSLLMEVYRQRAGKLSAADVLRQHEKSVFTQPSTVNARSLAQFDSIALACLPKGFEPLELSPVAALGTNSALATVDQNKVLTTSRNTEVCADPTNVMALECARRRRKNGSGITKLAASHRVLRTEFPRLPGYLPHFQIFTLCTAGRTAGSFRFEAEALREHLGFYVDTITSARRAGFSAGKVRVLLTALESKFADVLWIEVVDKLTSAYPRADFAFDPDRTQGLNYYQGAAFEIRIADASGNEHSIADGGFTDWTQQLLANRKERLLISGFGTERFVACFTPSKT